LCYTGRWRVPENALKFAVGVMLAAFGLFWTGEGFGVAWPGADLAILAFIALFLRTASLASRSLAAASPPRALHEPRYEGHSMKNWTALLRELAGLFIEDGALALAIVAVVACAGIVAALAPAVSWLSGLILLLGCLGVLVGNVVAAKRN
jgi:Ca2+/H+ antiporter, TMEM165/GDT1 family